MFGVFFRAWARSESVTARRGGLRRRQATKLRTWSTACSFRDSGVGFRGFGFEGFGIAVSELRVKGFRVWGVRALGFSGLGFEGVGRRV